MISLRCLTSFAFDAYSMRGSLLGILFTQVITPVSRQLGLGQLGLGQLGPGQLGLGQLGLGQLGLELGLGQLGLKIYSLIIYFYFTFLC